MGKILGLRGESVQPSGPDFNPAGAVILDPNIKQAMMVPTDLVDQRVLREGGPTWFFTDGKPWAKLARHRDVMAVTVLGAANKEETVWNPIVGARVVLKFKAEPTDFVSFDLCTKGDGSTITLPVWVAPVPTPVGQMVHIMLLSDTQFRVEIDAPGFEGAVVRAILHGNESHEIKKG